MDDRIKLKVIRGGKHQIPENQLPLFGIGKTVKNGDKTLEKRIEDARPAIFNNLPDYGFSKESLRPFLRKTKLADGRLIHLQEDGLVLEKAYEGMNNFESRDGMYGVANNILIRMNTTEILAQYIGIQQTKVDRYSNFNESYKLLKLGFENFPAMISELVSIGYQYRGIKDMARLKKGFSGHPIHKGSLIQRMQDVPIEDREKFIKSLLIIYRQFGYTTKELRYEFRDPFEKDEKRYDYTGKEIWIVNIVDFMHKVYLHNVKTNEAKQ